MKTLLIIVMGAISFPAWADSEFCKKTKEEIKDTKKLRGEWAEQLKKEKVKETKDLIQKTIDEMDARIKKAETDCP